MASSSSTPWIQVPGVHNFRDLGGYPISHSPSTHSVRRDVIYRCAEPTKATENGVNVLRSLGITHYYDLRSANEIENNKKDGYGGIQEFEGAERVFVPVFLDQDYDPEKIAIRFKDYASQGSEGFARAYKQILENAPASYRQILLHLANEPVKPLAIHCSAGKDRTGVLCALILSLCGVDDNTVAYEYSLTDIGLMGMKSQIVESLMASPAFTGDRQGVLNMVSAKAENMLATLKMVREEFGGPERYMIDKCGLTHEDIQKIRANLVVETPPVHIEIPKI